jgi:hypothetical protein
LEINLRNPSQYSANDIFIEIFVSLKTNLHDCEASASSRARLSLSCHSECVSRET